MRFYRLNHGDANLGNAVTWFASERAAKQELARLRETGELDTSYPSSIDLVNIPTDKAGLLDWLNANLTTDNG
jgi:hypothetical protein